MQRPPLFESVGFIYWKIRFETYVKSKDLVLWHIITDGDFPHIQNIPETKKDEVVPFNKQNDDLKKKLAKNNEAKMVNKITTPCEICSGPHDTQYCMENPEQAFVTYASSCIDEAGDKYVKSLELGKNGSAFIQGETRVKMGDLRLFTLPCRLGDSKPFDTLADLGSCVNIIPLYLFKTLNIGLLEETDHIFGLADGTKSYPVGIVKDVEVEGITRSVFGVKGKELGKEEAPYWTTLRKREWEISRDAELNPFKDTLVFRRMVIFDEEKLGSS
ncbi:hypothetical protein Tco_0262305 [Tanacetum coccineum]